MTPPFHVLYVDDSPFDRQLVRDILEIERSDFVMTEATSRLEFENRLDEGIYDVVLSDFNILGFEGLQVIEAVRAKNPDIPVVIFTGTGSEEIAVEAMKKGATDYVIKSPPHAKRLPVTIQSAIDRKRLQKQHEQDRKLLQESEDNFRSLFENSFDAILLTAPDGQIFKANAQACGMFGYDEKEIVSAGREGLLDTTDPSLPVLLEERRLRGKASGELHFRRKDGSVFLGEVSSSIFINAKGEPRTSMTIRDVSQLRALEEERTRLFNLVVDVLCVVGFDGYFRQINPAGSNILGWSTEELLEKSWTEFVHPEDREATDNLRSALIDSKAVCDFENRYLCKDGSYKCLSWNFFSVPQEKLIYAVGRDVTEQKTWETKLLRSEEKYRTIFEHAPIGIYHFDETGVITDCNEAFVSIIGSSKEKLLGLNTLSDLKDKQVIDSVRNALTNGLGIYEGDYSSVTTRKTTPVRAHFRGLVRVDGTASGGIAIVEDLSERRRSENALRQSEGKYRVVVENASDGILVAQDDRVCFVNSRLAGMLGYDKKELLGKTFAEFIHPGDQQMATDRHRKRLAGEQPPSRYFLRLVGKNGNARWHEIAAGLIDWEGRPAALVMINDVHDRRKEEEARLRLSTAVEQAAEAVVITDTAGRIQYVNPAFETISGYSKGEAIGNSTGMWEISEYQQSTVETRHKTVTGGRVWKGRIECKTKNGRSFIEDATISPVFDSGGKIVNYVGVTRDVTDEILLQKQLIQAQKMESIGTLAGGIAHDFNNLLQVILGYTEILLMEQSRSSRESKDLKSIHHAAKRGAELVRQILTFSRKMATNPRPIDLNGLLIDAQKLLGRTIPKMVDIELRLGENLESINADPGQIEQALLNLAVNSRDAMPEGGKLTIITRNVFLDMDYCQTQIGVQPGQYVVLEVSDTGFGMDKDVVDHIFEPFYTTKGPAEGTGLGLAMVYGIVKGHGGHITCYSQPGLGTTFRLYLPAVLHEETPEIDKTDDQTAIGSETILLVDDDELIREFGSRVLERSGYTALKAGNGYEALDIYSKSADKISLVILDLIMPLMGGKECLMELLRINPKVKALVASGFYVDAQATNVIETGAKGFVQKPFEMQELLSSVRKALDED